MLKLFAVFSFILQKDNFDSQKWSKHNNSQITEHNIHT